jgi:hypothetical protein
MFGALIRKKSERAQGSVEAAIETTEFSLSAAVPRPVERRMDNHLPSLLPAAKLIANGSSGLCRIRNISAGGLSAEVAVPHAVGSQVVVELNSHRQVSGQVVWVREGLLGIKFNSSVDMRALFSKDKDQDLSARPPRIEVGCTATIRLGKLYHQVRVQDVSLGGMKVALDDPDCVGREVTVTVDSLRPARGRIRWHNDGHAGVVFDTPYSFEELGEWLAKRIEIASLRTGAKDALRREPIAASAPNRWSAQLRSMPSCRAASRARRRSCRR